MILSVKNLSFDYSDASVLHDLSFSLDKGDFLGIIGSNGTGKSTLIKLILGLLPVQNGHIKLMGQDRQAVKTIKGVGYVSQKAASFNSRFPATVKEVVCANLYKGICKRISPEDEALFIDVIGQVGMAGMEKRLIGNLSGGQQQKVFIARALIAKPEILFLDEPTVGIDAHSVREISALIETLNRKGMTIVMTNHDTQALTKLSSKLLLLSDEESVFIDKAQLSEKELAAIIREGA